MTETPSKGKVVLARLVLAVMIIFVLLGLAMYGFSAEVRERIWQNLLERPGGPMTFRFFLQPTMATVVAFLDGLKDARSGRSPYFWTILTKPAERAKRLNEGLIATARIILLGLVMDLIYQFIVLDYFHPGEAVIIAGLLAFLPYLVLRGPITRIARWWIGVRSAKGTR
jgi:hypothetical protein